MGALISVVQCYSDDVVYVWDAEQQLRKLGWIRRDEAHLLAIHDTLSTPGFGFQIQMQAKEVVDV